MASDPLDRSSNPLAPDPVAPRPGDEALDPLPLDEDPELDPDKVRTETGDDDVSPDDPR
ncbi:hypothetical protein [Pseudomonas sp. RIT-To-2]|uniref:hypothetical protein n=1 Tax=Pseudomonas sp. RIT-To-2 TaxID=3462541 RepID=UPI00241320FA